MAKIKKENPPLYLVIPDTNILWHKDKGPAVNPDFDNFWNEQSRLVAMELIIPAVVRGELLYQQTTSALKAHDKISEHCAEIANITQCSHRNRLQTDKIKKQIEAKLDKWITGKGASVALLPVKAINLQQIAEAAIWRIPPFEADAKNPDHEKGFRDALILETVSDITARETRDVIVAFVSNDYLLRSSVVSRLKDDNKVMCFESLQDLASYLKLTREKLTNAFIRDIINKAAEKFYSNSDESCLVVRDKLLDRIRSEHKNKFENPDDSAPSNLSTIWSSFLPSSTESWKAIDGGKWYLAGTEFSKLDGEREYHWKSGLTFVRFYTRASNIPIGLRMKTTTAEKIQILPFKVSWKANVKADGRFHDTSVVSITLENGTFKEPTEQQIEKYKPTTQES